MTILLTSILASSIALSSVLTIEPESQQSTENTENLAKSTAVFQDASELLDALSTHDERTHSMTGTIRFTTINALENDRQQRTGNLSIQRQDDGSRNYAVIFKILTIDERQETIDEHYIFDGRWFVERLPEEKQFNKHELVPEGQTLDPMELMRDAPFWVSVGHDQDRLLASYNADLLSPTDGLIENPDFPELEHLTASPLLTNTTQLRLTPKRGTPAENDWEWVRIWINQETLQPALYIKAEWTGDLQIVELFGVKDNPSINPSIFDTTSPDVNDGWNIQVSHWRGKGSTQE